MNTSLRLSLHRNIKNFYCLFIYATTFALLIKLSSDSQAKIGETKGNSWAGMPFSDAAGWWSCTANLAFNGDFPYPNKEFCMRRPLFPILGSYLYRVSESGSQFLYLINFLFVLSITALSIVLLGSQRFIFTPFIVWLSFLHWNKFGNGMFMTESLAISFAVFGISALVLYLHLDRTIFLTLCGIFFLLSQAIRPGNLFIVVVPFLIGLITKRLSLRGALLRISLIYSVFFIFQRICRLFVWPSFMDGGNTWPTLWGLQNSNKTWQDAYAKYAHLFGSETETHNYIRQVFINEFLHNPLPTFHSIITNSWLVLVNAPRNFLGLQESREIGLFWFFVIGLSIYSVVRIKTLSLIPFCLVISEMLFYGISGTSDPYRSMSSSLIFAYFILFESAFARKPFSTNNTNAILKDSVRERVNPYKSELFLTFGFLLFMTLTVILPFNRSVSVGGETRVKGFLGGHSDSSLDLEIGISDIRTSSDYWWKPILDEVPPGTFYRTILVKDGKSFAISFFVAEKDNYSSSLSKNCFVLNVEPEIEALSRLGFSQSFPVNC